MHLTLAFLAFAILTIGATAAPLPLNINLGAYSPALVVGDGALTFEGGEEAARPGAPAAERRAKRDLIDAVPYVTNMRKRDLAGFDRALTFAEAALTKGPKVQLGTGEDGAGVGIIVDNNIDAAARAGRGTGA
jgi:hypothetical protein